MQNKLPLSYIEISKGNLIHNIKQFRAVVDKKTKISAVVKANAYGHGDVEVVKILSPFIRLKTPIRKPALNKTGVVTITQSGTENQDWCPAFVGA